MEMTGSFKGATGQDRDYRSNARNETGPGCRRPYCMRRAGGVYTPATSEHLPRTAHMNTPSVADARPVRLSELSHGGG